MQRSTIFGAHYRLIQVCEILQFTNLGVVIPATLQFLQHLTSTETKQTNSTVQGLSCHSAGKQTPYFNGTINGSKRAQMKTYNTEYVGFEGITAMNIQTAVSCDVMSICTHIFKGPAASIIRLK